MRLTILVEKEVDTDILRTKLLDIAQNETERKAEVLFEAVGVIDAMEKIEGSLK